ncbi:uncharacterized protein LOC135347464 [Halichondria panicea]|uniref:uncharacterized protein LOC135347464 n=1 Tax=Halichondria panicea TaxID=6063 RepID=UPI00312BA5C2
MEILGTRLKLKVVLLMVWLGIVVVLSLLTYHGVRVTPQWPGMIKQFHIRTNSTTTVATDDIEIAPTRFVYLTQTESCIPTYLKSPKVIGDSEACQCDIIILSFKKECNDTSTSFPHVQYIFNSGKSTTWTVGRNLLYQAAKERKEKYMYYIFMDDDLQLIMADKKNTQNPWRMYEESLKTFQLAVVTLLITYEQRGFSRKTFPERLNCELTGYIQVYDMDAIFNAFHYQAIDYILPYTTSFDSVGWWHSQVYLMIKCNILFNDEVVIDPRIKVINSRHRDYPRKEFFDDVNQIVTDIRSETPEKYRKSVEPILQQWLANFHAKKLLGRQTCKRDLFVHPYRPYENLA